MEFCAINLLLLYLYLYRSIIQKVAAPIKCNYTAWSPMAIWLLCAVMPPVNLVSPMDRLVLIVCFGKSKPLLVIFFSRKIIIQCKHFIADCDSWFICWYVSFNIGICDIEKSALFRCNVSNFKHPRFSSLADQNEVWLIITFCDQNWTFYMNSLFLSKRWPSPFQQRNTVGSNDSAVFWILHALLYGLLHGKDWVLLT